MNKKMLLIVLVFSVLACNSLMSESIEISGVSNSYRIPVDYMKQNDSLFGLEEYNSDSAKSVSLLIPNELSSPNKENSEFSLLLFLDRQYESDSDIQYLAKNMLVDAHQVENTGIYRFIAGPKRKPVEYYVSFDPYGDGTGRGDNKYLAEVVTPEILDIPEIKGLAPKTTCRLWFVEDGILFQLVAVGGLCHEAYFDPIINNIRALMQKWRL